MSFAKKIFILQANAIDQQIGYPDYLNDDNNTKLEHDYAEVKIQCRISRSFSFVNYFSIYSIRRI